jgi:hypothetical protein
MSASRRDRGPFPWTVHPIWRGIGCLLLILLPIIAFGLAELLLAWVASQNPSLGRTLTANTNLLSNPLFVKAVLALVISMALYLVFSTLGSLVYSLMGGPRNKEIAERTRSNVYRRR